MNISVVMAAYNHAAYISDAVESVLNQTLSDFEFIIVNDGSVDDSARIIEQLSRSDDRIVFVNSEKNSGAANARNVAIHLSKGKYVAVFDSDDICLPKRLETQYLFLEKNEDCYLVGGAAIRIDENGNKASTFDPPTNFREVHGILPHDNCIYHPSIMFRNTKEVFYREKFETIEDYDFYLNLLSSGKKLTNIRDIIIKYRLRTGYATSSRLQKQLILAKKAQEYYNQRITAGRDMYDELDLEELLKPVNNARDN